VRNKFLLASLYRCPDDSTAREKPNLLLMKKLLPLLFFSVLAAAATAQPYNPEKVNKKARELFEQAMERAQDGNIVSATGLLLKCIELDNKFADAYLSLAGAYGQLKSYASSIKYYELAFAVDSNYTMDYKLPYSINLAGMGEFEKALAAINQLLTKKMPPSSPTFKAASSRKKSYAFAADYARNNNNKIYVFAPQNLGSNINTSEPEYFPSLTIDGKEFVFTRRLNNHNEDFFSSAKTHEGWDKASPLKGNVNTPDNEAGQNISQDGQWLVFTANGRPQGFGNFDIYMSYLTPQGWSEAANLGGKVNSDQWDSQPCLSPDKRELYFASRRMGGYGGTDIYICRMQPNGKWGDAQNMGPGINTTGDDQCPFIHADNQTLYFTSNGLPGYGGNDLFYVRKGPGGVWSKPINLGYPINTINDEGTLFIAADGKTAYYASDRSDSKGGNDIYSFELREDLRPFKTLWVQGQVIDKKTTRGLPSTVELTDLATGEVITKVQTDETGHYFITLPVGKDYAFNVNRKGYLFYSDNFLMSGLSPDTTYEKNIALLPIETNASMVLKNIFFDVNKFDVKPSSQAELDILVQLLNENATLKIEISGYTDNAGKPADNLALSNNRAKAVVSYLVSRNIAATRLTAKGYGETKPVADNKTEEGKAMNRRTEMKVTGR
jgi:outer membrane protein OmpA-like peptidoglycan-associated protein/tetratricopeptide (TPR) repeat protein